MRRRRAETRAVFEGDLRTLRLLGIAPVWGWIQRGVLEGRTSSGQLDLEGPALGLDALLEEGPGIAKIVSGALDCAEEAFDHLLGNALSDRLEAPAAVAVAGRIFDPAYEVLDLAIAEHLRLDRGEDAE